MSIITSSEFIWYDKVNGKLRNTVLSLLVAHTHMLVTQCICAALILIPIFNAALQSDNGIDNSTLGLVAESQILIRIRVQLKLWF